MGVAASMRARDLVQQFAEDNVAHEARLIAQQVKGTYSALRNDTLVLSRTPSIQGIMRSDRGNGVDPADGATTKQWRSRLETTFAALLKERPGYTQIRFIGVADGGRELVRVNRTADRIVPVPEGGLQRKGQEPYFQRALALKPGAIYLSDVTYNREFGKVDAERIPTIRAVVPVFDQNGSLFGVVAINANYEKLLGDYFDDYEIKRDVIISNSEGDYVVHGSGKGISGLHLNSDADYDPPAFLKEHHSVARAEWASVGAAALTYSVRVPISQGAGGRYVVVSVSVPRDAVYAPAQRTLREGLTLTVLIIVLAVLATMYLASRMTAPLSAMTRKIENSVKEGAEPDLPVERKDEAGKLARAFSKLVHARNEYGARMRAIIDNAADGIVSFDGHGTVLTFNPASERLFGYASREAVGQNVSVLIPHIDAGAYGGTAAPPGQNAAAGKSREMDARRKDGSLFPVEVSVSRVGPDAGQPMYIGIIRDITERRQIEIMQNEFVSTVNHELRTPLTSIRASLGMLQHRISGKVDEKSQRLIDLSLGGAERLSWLVDDILDLEKIAAGKMDLTFEDADIAELTAAVVDHHRSLAEAHQVHFDVHIGLDRPYFCRLDTSRYSQALANLLANAAKFSPAGGRVLVDLAMSGTDKVAVSVIDKGVGIPASFHSKVFQRFAQADSSSRRSAGGSGLGLNISQSIIAAFDGTIHFDSTEGEGSTFIITLPIVSSLAQPESDPCKAV
ncbi:sensor histidine kinase [Novosphingobium beihaiensis]|uniref:histidine kinase n=1 Tax=Novosphingobium beihaiensis TaxID=2930389 RepID=A0ABT0BUY3_9SPHN|nr:ATP-binding protein [Novosphingobium beihaiensis]MCJ2188861.1 PAS domain S-box protein [Novosphingobium beihaiensis]